jgi:hypothetical protein
MNMYGNWCNIALRYDRQDLGDVHPTTANSRLSEVEKIVKKLHSDDPARKSSSDR